MIIKSYIAEQNIEILTNYQAVLIYGENKGIQDDIKNKIKAQNKDSEVITFFENDLLKNNLLYEKISNQSLFASKKIIFLQEISDKIFSKIEECLEKRNDDTKIYLFSNILEKKSKIRTLFEKNKKLAIIPCYTDNERTLINYINNNLKNFKGLSGEITNIIINNSNMDRRLIKTELEKITSFFEGKKIDKSLVLEILNIKRNISFNEIRDKALMGEKKKVNNLLSETEILNDDVFFYLNILNQRITRLQQIIKIAGNSKNFEETVENLKPPIFWKDKPVILQQLKKWSQNQLEAILIKIGETEILMKKNSYLRNDILIKDLVVNLANKNSTS